MDTRERILDLIDKSGNEDKDVALALGFGRGAITDWRLGRTHSYRKKIQEIAKYFNVNTAYLLGEIDDPRPIELTPFMVTFDNGQHILSPLPSLDGQKNVPPADQGALQLREVLEQAGFIQHGEVVSDAKLSALFEFIQQNQKFLSARSQEIENEGK